MSKIQSGCNSDCMHCGEAGCGSRVAEPVEAKETTVEETVKNENEVTKSENTEDEKKEEKNND